MVESGVCHEHASVPPRALMLEHSEAPRKPSEAILVRLEERTPAGEEGAVMGKPTLLWPAGAQL